MGTILNYYAFIIPIIVLIIIQATKFVLYSLKNGWDWQYVFTHGHMPSSHTAFVVSVTTSVGYFFGTTSGAFAVAFIFSIIIIDDATRLRVYMGDQGRYLNMLIQELHINEGQFPRLKERIGHRISEVIVGGILGFLLTLALAELLTKF